MKIYIVTESNKEDNLILRSWVCFTKEQANECLKKYYDIAGTYNRLAGVEVPTNCLDYGFFSWDLLNGMEIRYDIRESQTFVE